MSVAALRARMGAGSSSLLSTLAVEYWLARNYSGTGNWLGSKGVANLTPTNSPRWLPCSTSQNPFGAGVKYTEHPGTVLNCVHTADAASLDILGDITVVGWIAPNDWTPSALQVIAAKCDVSGQFSWFMYLNTDGVIRFSWFSGGTGATQITISSTVATGFTDGTARYVAASLDVDNGSTQNVVTFWTSTDGATWAQLGSPVTTAGVAAIFSSTSRLEIGSFILGSSSPFAGKIARVQVYSGVRDFSGTPSGGTLVADYNPTAGTINTTATSLTGTGDGRTYTLGYSTSGPRLGWTDRDGFGLGTNRYFTTADNANFDFGASQDFTIAALFRSRQDADSNYRVLVAKRDVSVGSGIGWETLVAGTGVTEEFGGLVDGGATLGFPHDTSWNNPGTLQTNIFTRTAGATGTLSVYADGVSVGGAAALPDDCSNAAALTVGSLLSGGAGSVFFEGLIHAVAIFRSGLTAAQVATLDAELRAVA